MRLPIVAANFVDDNAISNASSWMPHATTSATMAPMKTCDHIHSCTVCGGPTHVADGIILNQVCPGALFCDGCGRRVVRCECEP